MELIFVPEIAGAGTRNTEGSLLQGDALFGSRSFTLVFKSLGITTSGLSSSYGEKAPLRNSEDSLSKGIFHLYTEHKSSKKYFTP